MTTKQHLAAWARDHRVDAPTQARMLKLYEADSAYWDMGAGWGDVARAVENQAKPNLLAARRATLTKKGVNA